MKRDMTALRPQECTVILVIINASPAGSDNNQICDLSLPLSTSIVIKNLRRQPRPCAVKRCMDMSAAGRQVRRSCLVSDIMLEHEHVLPGSKHGQDTLHQLMQHYHECIEQLRQ